MMGPISFPSLAYVCIRVIIAASTTTPPPQTATRSDPERVVVVSGPTNAGGWRHEPRDNPLVAFPPPARHLLRARDLADSRYYEPLGVEDLAGAAGLSRAHFIREFRRAFGESPHAYLLTRRLERAASLLRGTDRSVADICFSVGLQSVGSFTTSFSRTFGMSPTAYRARFPPAADQALVPGCVLRAYGRPQRRTFREDSGSTRA
jgi:AraC-like DNA-binding protein